MLRVAVQPRVLYAEHCRADAAALQGGIAAVSFSRRPMLASLGLDFPSATLFLTTERKGKKQANTDSPRYLD